MYRLPFLIISLLLSESSGQESNVFPRKSNIISQFLDKALDSLFDELSSNNLSISAINLGEKVGSITNVEGNFLKLQKHVDGYKSFGFTLDANATEILLTGSYDILNLDIPGLFPAYGKGNFRVAVKGVNLNLCLKALYNSSSEKFDMTVLKFDILVQKSTVKFDNLMNDPFITDFLNELISNIVPDLAKVITQPATKLLQDFLDFFGNGIFECIKKESTMEKIEECIKNLFPTYAATICPLTKKVEMLLPELAINLNKKLAPKV